VRQHLHHKRVIYYKRGIYHTKSITFSYGVVQVAGAGAAPHRTRPVAAAAAAGPQGRRRAAATAAHPPAAGRESHGWCCYLDAYFHILLAVIHTKYIEGRLNDSADHGQATATSADVNALFKLPLQPPKPGATAAAAAAAEAAALPVALHGDALADAGAAALAAAAAASRAPGGGKAIGAPPCILFS
jgi:hypothetical protein